MFRFIKKNSHLIRLIIILPTKMIKRTPPSTSSPLSRELVDSIIKKKSAPLSPAPHGFKPKDLNKIIQKKNQILQSNDPNDESSSNSDDESKSSSSSSDSETSVTIEGTSFGTADKKVINNTKTQQVAITKKISSVRNTIGDSKPSENKISANNSSIAHIPTTVFKFSKEPSVTNQNQPINFDFLKFLRGAKNRKLKQFLLSPCPPNTTIRCYIERDRFGSNLLSPVYTLCADLTDGTGQELMVCKKVFLSRTPHYVFSIMSTDLYKSREQRSKLYLGKLRSTVPGSYSLLSEEVPSLRELNNEVGSKQNFSLTSSSFTTTTSSSVNDDDKTFHSRAIPKGRSSEHDDAMHSSSSTVTIEVPIRARGSEDNDMDGDIIKSSADAGTGQDRLEAASIIFHTTTRPAPDGVRGCEICLPHPDTYSTAKNTESDVPSAMKNLDGLFTKIRATGKQNELHAEECIVLNERKTK